MYVHPPTNHVPTWWEILVVAVAVAGGLIILVLGACCE